MFRQVDAKKIIRRRYASRTQKSRLTQNEVLTIFKEILREMMLPTKTIESRLDYSGKFNVSVTFLENGSVNLYYCDYYLNTLSKDEVRAVLSHEACHIATLPNSKLPYDTEASQYVNWFNQTLWEIYCEWLAHQEFVRRFGQDIRLGAYRSIKIEEFEAYADLVEQSRARPQFAAHGLYAILNDAVFFSVIGDDAFTNWAANNDLSELIKLLNWLVEDFQYVESLKLGWDEAIHKLRNIGQFCLNIDADILMSADTLRFVKPPVSKRDHAKLTIDSIIESNWKRRGIISVG
jgi:hypothetical protein